MKNKKQEPPKYCGPYLWELYEKEVPGFERTWERFRRYHRNDTWWHLSQTKRDAISRLEIHFLGTIATFSPDKQQINDLENRQKIWENDKQRNMHSDDPVRKRLWRLIFAAAKGDYSVPSGALGSEDYDLGSGEAYTYFKGIHKKMDKRQMSEAEYSFYKSKSVREIIRLTKTPKGRTMILSF